MTSKALTALLFEIADQRYALDVSQIIEVVPAVKLRKIPSVPDYVAGVFNFRGTIVPVIDLSRMIGGTFAANSFSTRIVLVLFTNRALKDNVFGLLVERATTVLTDDFGEPSASGIATPAAPYLGKIAMTGADSVQFVTVASLIPDNLRDILFVDT